MKIFLFVSLLLITFGCKDNSKEVTKVVARQQQSPELKASIDRGAGIYNNFCASCHLSGGEGITGVFPPLNNSNWLNKKQKESIHAIKFGLRGPIEVNGVAYDNLMPSLGLSNAEIADVMNYINNSWENNIGKQVTEEDVKAIAK